MSGHARLALAAVTAAVLCAGGGTAAQAAGLDPAFGTAGRTLVSFGSGDTEDVAGGLALAPDGRIVASALSDQQLAVVRLLADGRPDPAFGDQGRVVINGFGARTNNQLNGAVAVQPDGRIVVAATVMNGPSGNAMFGVARLRDDGSLDASFGQAGKVVTKLAEGAGAEPAAVAIAPDGKIVVAGLAFVGPAYGGSGFAVVRYLADGAADPAFGDGGHVILPPNEGSPADAASAVLVGADGSVLLGGTTLNAGTSWDLALVRLRPDGSPDPAFGTGGRVRTNIGPGVTGDVLSGLTPQADGGLLATGTWLSGDFSRSGFAAVRYDAAGAPVAGFGTGGAVAAGGPADGGGRAAMSGADAYVAGSRGTGDRKDTAVLALDASGRPDAAFAAGGLFVFPLVAGDAVDQGIDIAGRPDGKLVVLSRVFGDGTGQDLGFALVDPGGRKTVPPPNAVPDSNIAALARSGPARRYRVFRGRASDDRGVARVEVALVRLGEGTAARRTCRLLRSRSVRWQQVRTSGGSCTRRRWLRADGRAAWRLPLRRGLPRGRYVLYSRAIDVAGARETTFSAKDRNRVAFRVTR